MPESLIKSLESVVGPDHATADSELMIGALRPAALVRPGSVEEVLACIRVCGEAGAAIVPSGLMTWLDCGNPLRSADVVLSLGRLNRILDYSPPDLTVTVQAGVGLNQLNETARRGGQWLPLDPAGSERASLGAVASCASSGPLRFGFGTPRDYVIGLRLAHADATESKCGGRVVKNVAGYDLSKLYVGSFGTLAVITELTFKLRPVPEVFSTLELTGNDSSLFETAAHVIESGLQPCSVLVESATGDEENIGRLLVRFADNESAVKSQIDRLRELGPADLEVREPGISESTDIWTAIANVDEAGSIALKMSVPPSKAMTAFSVFREAVGDGRVVCDVATGVIRGAWSQTHAKTRRREPETLEASELIGRLRREAEGAGGSLFVEQAPMEIRQSVDAWGDPGPVVRLMKAMKEKFDPQGMLNPGRFVAGI